MIVVLDGSLELETLGASCGRTTDHDLVAVEKENPHAAPK